MIQSEQIWCGNIYGEEYVSAMHPSQLLHVCTHFEMTTKFCVVIKLDVRKVFTGWITSTVTWSVGSSRPSCYML